MQAARRVYVYVMSGVSLGALVIGLTMLLGVLLERLGLGAGGDVVAGGDETIRQQLTVAAALIAVSLPVWLVHWFLAERAVSPDRPGGLSELNAPERGLYFAIVLGILLGVGATSVASAMQGAILRLADQSPTFHDVAGDLGRALVALAFWGYHVRVRFRDWTRRTLTREAAFLPRGYRYVAAFIGLLVLLFGLANLFELVGRLLLDEPSVTVGDDGDWWAYPLASALSGVVVGGAVWIGHWAYSTRLLGADDGQGASERASRLRLGFFVVAMVATATATLYFVGLGAGAALQLAFGLADISGPGQAVGLVAVPLVSAVPFGIAWWVHARWLDDEPISVGTEQGAATADRLRLYPVALVALAVGSIGAAWLLGILIDGVFGARPLGGDLSLRALAQFAPYAAIGWAAWTWRWVAVVRRTASDPSGEALSTTRRSALLIALAVAVLAGIGAAGVILYRIFGSLFGVTLTGDPVSELSLPIGILLVALAVAAGHGALLRRDLAIRGDVEAATSAEPTNRSVRLRLTGPSDAMERAIAALGGATPDGYVLELDAEPPSGG